MLIRGDVDPLLGWRLYQPSSSAGYRFVGKIVITPRGRRNLGETGIRRASRGGRAKALSDMEI